MANSVKRNASKGLSVTLATALAGIIVELFCAKVYALDTEAKVALVGAITGALIAAVDAIKHRG